MRERGEVSWGWLIGLLPAGAYLAVSMGGREGGVAKGVCLDWDERALDGAVEDFSSLLALLGLAHTLHESGNLPFVLLPV